jgi:hypothetical protein
LAWLLIVSGITTAVLAWSRWRDVETLTLGLLAIPFLMCASTWASRLLTGWLPR